MLLLSASLSSNAQKIQSQEQRVDDIDRDLNEIRIKIEKMKVNESNPDTILIQGQDTTRRENELKPTAKRRIL